MATAHLEVLAEEPSMEAFLAELLPRLLPQGRTFQVHTFQGKGDLLAQLEKRLRGYAAWMPEDYRILVVVDRDDEECRQLKRRMEAAARAAGLRTRSAAAGGRWQLVNRIAVEELEAWYFGDWEAVRAAYPRVSATVPRQARFREPDDIKGGTWEAFERVMQRHGYFEGGLPKIEVARLIGALIEPDRNASPSFRVFRAAVIEAFA